MIRALALAYSVATARWLILGLGLFGLPFARVFVPASGLGVFVNLVLAEWLLGGSGILATYSMHTPVSRQKPLPGDEG